MQLPSDPQHAVFLFGGASAIAFHAQIDYFSIPESVAAYDEMGKKTTISTVDAEIINRATAKIIELCDAKLGEGHCESILTRTES